MSDDRETIDKAPENPRVSPPPRIDELTRPDDAHTPAGDQNYRDKFALEKCKRCKRCLLHW